MGVEGTEELDEEEADEARLAVSRPVLVLLESPQPSSCCSLNGAIIVSSMSPNTVNVGSTMKSIKPGWRL